MAVEYINENDTLNAGRVKINAAIEKATNAKISASQAMAVANDAKTQAQSTQRQLDNIIIENGQSDAEVVQARTKADGTTYPLLKDRLNSSDEQLDKLTLSLYGNEKKKKGIAVTIDANYSENTLANWANLLADVDCEVELCTMEYISSDQNIDFTPVTNYLDKIHQVIENIGKPICMLKPHIGTISAGDGFYRGNYFPSDINGFFINWGNRLQEYTQICRDHNIPILCISCEQEKLTVNTYIDQWKNIIADCKDIFPNLQIMVAYTRFEVGRDLYAYKAVETLLDYCDIIGCNYYPELLRENPIKYLFGYPDPNGIQDFNEYSGFFNMDKQLADLKSKYSKNIYITETGVTQYSFPEYPTIANRSGGVVIDRTDQIIYTEQILSYLLNNVNVDGVFLWHISEPYAILNGETKDIIKKYYNI